MNSNWMNKQRRIALVIGNSVYRSYGELPNAVNDARAVTKKLPSLGFEVNTFGSLRDLTNRDLTNIDTDTFQFALAAFEREMESADIAMFYFAGHGLQVNGANILLPVDASPASDLSEEDQQFIDLRMHFRRVYKARSKYLIFLDACRVFPEATGGSLGSLPSVSMLDVARLRPRAQDIHIASSSAPGQPADDGPTGQLSPFAKAFTSEIDANRVTIAELMDRVRHAVYEYSASRMSYGNLTTPANVSPQTPWSAGSLATSSFILRPIPLLTATLALLTCVVLAIVPAIVLHPCVQELPWCVTPIKLLGPDPNQLISTGSGQHDPFARINQSAHIEIVSLAAIITICAILTWLLWRTAQFGILSLLTYFFLLLWIALGVSIFEITNHSDIERLLIDQSNTSVDIVSLSYRNSVFTAVGFGVVTLSVLSATIATGAVSAVNRSLVLSWQVVFVSMISALVVSYFAAYLLGTPPFLGLLRFLVGQVDLNWTMDGVKRAWIGLDMFIYLVSITTPIAIISAFAKRLPANGIRY